MSGGGDPRQWMSSEEKELEMLRYSNERQEKEIARLLRKIKKLEKLIKP